jgi:hypothetical protein
MQKHRQSVFLEGVASGAFAALLFAVALSVSPQWHEHLHADATAARHECAVTLVSSGNYSHSFVAPVVAGPAPILQFRFTPTVHPIWVASLFVCARVFEHGPPSVI